MRVIELSAEHAEPITAFSSVGATHSKGSDAGMTALMVQIRDLTTTDHDAR